MSRCWRCGRAIDRRAATSYIYGVVCHRAECRQVNQALSDRFKPFWMYHSFGVHKHRPSVWNRNGEFQNVSGYAEPSLQRKIDMDRKLEARR